MSYYVNEERPTQFPQTCINQPKVPASNENFYYQQQLEKIKSVERNVKEYVERRCAADGAVQWYFVYLPFKDAVSSVVCSIKWYDA
jgi:hypothetical protein